MAKKIKSTRAIANAIKRTLKKEGGYSPSFDMAINDLAEVTHLKERAFRDATEGFTMEARVDAKAGGVRGALGLDEDEGGYSVVFEYSREGDRRYKINPAYTIYLELARESQRMLSELCMTAKSSKAVQDDLIEEMDRQINAAGNG